MAHVKILAQDDQDGKADDKEGEKDAGKFIKDEVELLVNNIPIPALYSHDRITCQHPHQLGKTRTHVNDVFRPPFI